MEKTSPSDNSKEAIKNSKNTDTKRKRGCRCCPNGNLAKPSRFSEIVWDKIPTVKKKRTKKRLKLVDIKKAIHIEEKVIIFDGEILWSHFIHKNPRERNSRQTLGLTVISALRFIDFDKNIGYFISKNQVFIVILSKVNEKLFIVKTYYRHQRLTKKLLASIETTSS